jgi:hypothetical protein
MFLYKGPYSYAKPRNMNGFDLYFLVAPKLVRTFFTSFVSVSLSSPFFLFFFVPAPVRLADVAEVGVAWFEADSFKNEEDRGVGAWEGVNCAGEGAGESCGVTSALAKHHNLKSLRILLR